MVTTRSNTDSLPEKKATLAELQATEAESQISANNSKAKRAASKAKSNAQPSTTKKETIAAPKAGEAESQTAEKTFKPKRTISKARLEANPTTTKKQKRLSPTPVPDPFVPELEGPTTFLDLPPELRNEIYSYALIRENVVELPKTPPYAHEPGLAAVSRQVRAEAIGIWYSENIFRIEGSMFAGKLLRTMPRDSVCALRELQIFTRETLEIKFAISRLQQLVQEHKGRGLRRQAVRFQVSAGMRMIWANLQLLERIQNGEEV